MTKIFSRHLGTPHDALKLFLGCAMLLGMGSHGHCTGYSKREIRLLVAGVVAKVGALIWGHSEPGCAMLLGMGSHGHCTGYSKREIRLLVAGVVAKVGALIWGHSEPIPPKQNGIFRSLDSTTR